MGRDDTVLGEWYAEGLRFSCTQCGNCCTGPTGFVWYTPDEAERIAAHLGISVAQFERRYARTVRGRRSLGENKTKFGYDCVFLTRDADGKAGCSIYPVRPMQCRTWPFWPENLASPEHYLQAARTCPGMRRGLEGEGTFVPIQQIRIRRDATDE